MRGRRGRSRRVDGGLRIWEGIDRARAEAGCVAATDREDVGSLNRVIKLLMLAWRWCFSTGCQLATDSTTTVTTEGVKGI